MELLLEVKKHITLLKQEMLKKFKNLLLPFSPIKSKLQRSSKPSLVLVGVDKFFFFGVPKKVNLKRVKSSSGESMLIVQ